ncbi:MAG: 50S ribosomal protein L11 methyltransferase [Pseudomonadota bacterium]
MARRFTVRERARSDAFRIAAFLEELAVPSPTAVSIFEVGDGWQIDAYFEHDDAPDDEAKLSDAVTTLRDEAPDGGRVAPTAAEIFSADWSDVEDQNWVAISQSALPPVEAGRFTVHGSHDRGRVPQGPNSIEIDAGEAFGTAHHATTYGCLIALSQAAARQSPSRILDLGTGSGVLAIAAARAWPKADVTAVDIDDDAVRVAAQNITANRCGNRVTVRMSDGTHRELPERFNLVIANILAEPLIAMAGDVVRTTAIGGRIILSGILIPQSAAVIAAYRSAGAHVVRHNRYEGWSTLELCRAGRLPQKPRLHSRTDADGL